MIQTTDLFEGASPHSGGAEVKGGVSGREPHSFPENLWEAHPLQGKTVWVDRVNKVHGIQPRSGFLGKAVIWGGPEEALG